MVRFSLATFSSLFLLSACADFKQEPIEEMGVPEGPGLFTGESGEFNIPLPDSWTSHSKKSTSPKKKKRRRCKKKSK